MGTGIGLSCNHCSYRPSFCVGIGEKFYPENIFQKELKKTNLYDLLENDKEYKRFRQAANLGGSLRPGYEYKIYQCKDCSALYNLFYLEVRINDYAVTPEYTCTACTEPLEEIDHSRIDELSIHCPLCEEGELQGAETFKWN